MAKRPIFVPILEGPVLVQTRHVEFQWFPGMSVSQKKKSIDSLHAAARQLQGIEIVLEVSSKSHEDVGVALSAFNLTFETVKLQRTLCVECAYQGSKVFERGGPYVDMFKMTAREAKKDDRLNSSGRLKGFRFFNTDWQLEPQTAFYDWLYINAINKKIDVIEDLLRYSAFTDIEFNPGRSVNCQAYSVALFVSLHQRGLLSRTLSRDEFLEIIQDTTISNAREDETVQRGFRLISST